MTGKPNNRLLRRPQVEEMTGLSRSSIYAKIAEGTFPRPVQIGARAVAWRSSDIQAWMDSLSVSAGPAWEAAT